MRTSILLLVALTTGYTCMAQSSRQQRARPKIKTVFNDKLLELTTAELELSHLRKIYGSALRVSKISRNIHDPATRDTLLAVATNADKFQCLSNAYNAFLLKGDFTSQKLAFGKGIKVGAAKAAFCKLVNLPATFDGYQIADAEGRSNIYFLFRQGTLAKVSYNVGWLD